MSCEAGAVQHRCVPQLAARLARAALLPLWGSALSRRYQSTPHDDVPAPARRCGRDSWRDCVRKARRAEQTSPDQSGVSPTESQAVRHDATPRGASTRRERASRHV